MEIHNRHYFTNLKNYDLKWTVEVDGVAVASGTQNLELAAGEKTLLTIPADLPKICALGAYVT